MHNSVSSVSLQSAQAAPLERFAPMWVVKVQDVLKMKGKLRPHQALKHEGLLFLRESLDHQLLVLFVSHQWVGRNHPDAKGEQLLALQSVLKKIHAGEILVEDNYVSQWQQQKRTVLSRSHCTKLLDAYIWYDYFGVPQQNEEVSVDREEQLAHIVSIPYYVNSCHIFLALTPSLKNESGRSLDYWSWLSRGWCRLEMWCKQLSDTSDIPVIVVESGETAHFVLPRWLQYPVSAGDFAVEADRFHCCQTVRKALESKLSKLYKRNMNQFRFFTARFDRMVGLPPTTRSLEDFWGDFHLLPGEFEQKGLSPVLCATLAEDTQILRRLAVARASLEPVAPEMKFLNIGAGFRPLHLAATFASHNLPLLETLLELRANPNSSPLLSVTPLACCLSAGAVELLVRHMADVNGRCGIFGFRPIHNLCTEGAELRAIDKLLELRADPNGGKGGAASVPPLATLCTAGCGALESAQRLLDQKADVNQRCQPAGRFRTLELSCRAVGLCRGAPGIFVNIFSNISTTPLGSCAMTDQKDLATFLLLARADPEIPNNRGGCLVFRICSQQFLRPCQ
ncbi:unnamed protein product [Effrenium voratum]|nr:unnamed protein product [Effrenium voratum]